MLRHYVSSYEHENEVDSDSSSDSEEADVETQSLELRQIIQDYKKTVLATGSRRKVEDILTDCVDRCEDYTNDGINELVLLLEEWGELHKATDLTLKEILDNVIRAPTDFRTEV